MPLKSLSIRNFASKIIRTTQRCISYVCGTIKTKPACKGCLQAGYPKTNY